MVWFHGRGFYAGAGSERLYDGARLAERGDLVVVTVNHRLNVFGYLYLGKVGGERFAASGNAGVQDMQLALEWVRDNIAAFGGDAGNVTIFGESGGGAKVSTLLGVPSARGLFRRGIIQSGARLTGMPLATAIAEHRNGDGKLKVTTVEQLQALPVDTVLAAVTDDRPDDARLRSGDRRPLSAGGHVRAGRPPPARAASRSSSAPTATSTRSTRATIRSSASRSREARAARTISRRISRIPTCDALLAAYRKSRPGGDAVGSDDRDPQQPLSRQRGAARRGAGQGRADVSVQLRLRADAARRGARRRDLRSSSAMRRRIRPPGLARRRSRTR